MWLLMAFQKQKKNLWQEIFKLTLLFSIFKIGKIVDFRHCENNQFYLVFDYIIQEMAYSKLVVSPFVWIYANTFKNDPINQTKISIFLEIPLFSPDIFVNKITK